MSLADIPYYRRRASEEKQLAEGSENPDVRRAHAELAKHYEALVANAGMLPPNRAGYDREQDDLNEP